MQLHGSGKESKSFQGAHGGGPVGCGSQERLPGGSDVLVDSGRKSSPEAGREGRSTWQAERAACGQSRPERAHRLQKGCKSLRGEGADA